MRVLTLVFDVTLFRVLLFSLTYAVIFMFLLMFFREKTVKRLSFILVLVVSFLYLNQEVYFSFVEGFYSVTIAGDFTVGLSFLSDYLTALQFGHLFYFLPIITLYLLNRYKLIGFNIEYFTLKQPLILLIVGFGLFFISMQTIDEHIEDSGASITYSDMDLYTYMYNSQDALKKFGLLTYTQRDFFSLFKTDPLSESEYEVLLDDYFQNQDKHGYNQYTRSLTNKNLILIMAESFDTFAINEQLTPNLYNLKENSAYFENFYSPLYYRSTADTEFLVQTSLYPDKNVTLSMETYLDNYFPYTLPKMFETRGYSTYSFHNYTDYFYPREQFHTETLGYDAYYGSDALGLLDNPSEGQIIFNHQWQSDLEMMELAIPYFIENDRFFVNMITVSGHFKYAADHEIAQKNVDAVSQYEIDNDIELNTQIFYYLAAQIEFDKAIGYLFQQLEEYDHLDDTVVIIFGDHYAYGVDKEDIWQYDDVKDNYSDMDIHNVPFMIYSSSSQLKGTIDNYMSTIDVLPTISNLFGLQLDYTKVFGRDALASKDDVVRFADMSFISRNFSYDSLSEEYDIINPTILPEYLIMMNNQIIIDYKYNLLVLEYDYFKKDE
ncbi:MAG: LTA synthase family protein [Firmicutes bacterium]|nr:LTA synthase family protein [Bacillota bacterium]